MHVLIIAQYFPPDMGGGATRAYNVAKGLVLNGCKVTVVAAFPHYPHGNIPSEYKWKPLKIEWFECLKVIRTFVPPLASKGLTNRAILFLSFILSSLLAIPLTGKIDVIWAANPNILSIIPALVFSLFKRCPIALNVDDPWPEDLYNFNLIKEGSLLSKIAELLARIAYHKARLITPISPGYTTIITNKYGVKPDKIRVVRAGVDIHKFKPLKKARNDNKFRVLYTGAFSVAYDFDQILMAAKLIEQEDNQVEFIIQGGGELADHIKTKVKELKLNNVKIIDKVISRGEVAQLLNTADVLILPLKDFGKPYLGISSKLYEYQAAGKPIICCAKGQPAEYVKETRSGIVVKPGDYEALAKAVLYLKENPELAEELGGNGRKYVEDKLSIEKIGLQMVETFRTLLEYVRKYSIKFQRCS